MQGLPFLCFVGENSNVQDPAAWLRAGDGVLAAWRAAEEGLGALQLAAAAAGTLPERHKEQQAAVGQLTVRAAGQQDGLPLPDSFTGRPTVDGANSVTYVRSKVAVESITQG